MEQLLRQSFTGLTDIEIANHTRDDIDAVVEYQTRELVRMKPRLAFKHRVIEQRLKEGAQGFFQWVKSTLQHLETACVSPEDVEESLDSLHQDIWRTYESVVQHLLTTKTGAYERIRIRAALMWLCSAARPLNTSELLTLVLLGNEYDDVSLEQVENARSSNADAAEELRALLGSCIEIVDRGNGELAAQLIHTSFKAFLTSPEMGISSHAQIQDVGFRASLAETHCARMSMAICKVSCLRLSQRSRFSGQHALLDYAWRFWAYHLNLSGRSLDGLVGRTFDRMLEAISADCLAFLDRLADCLCNRYNLSGVKRRDKLHFVRAFQQAQRALTSPV